MKEVDVLVVGAGAAGCFTSIITAENSPNASVLIFEKSNKILAKVKVSGGGRCNVTNELSEPNELCKSYPRGEKFLKKAFYHFSSKHMIEWLERKGVKLSVQSNGCVFPESNSSQTIIDCFVQEMNRLNVVVETNQHVADIQKMDANTFKVQTKSTTILARKIIVTVGGQPKSSGFDFLSSFSLNFVPPVPSLFTFNLPNQDTQSLMGLSQDSVRVRLEGEKWFTSGSLLFTHWGMSGPAILKASAIGARILEAKAYNTAFYVNWTGVDNQEDAKEKLFELQQSSKLLVNTPVFSLKARLWEFLLNKIGFHASLRGNELTLKHINKLVELLSNDKYLMSGKTTFKEEFVTAGGISLNQINVNTMEANAIPGLYFAGEALDIDGITGGFNFQAAWTTAYIAGSNVLKTKNL